MHHAPHIFAILFCTILWCYRIAAASAVNGPTGASIATKLAKNFATLLSPTSSSKFQVKRPNKSPSIGESEITGIATPTSDHLKEYFEKQRRIFEAPRAETESQEIKRQTQEFYDTTNADNRGTLYDPYSLGNRFFLTPNPREDQTNSNPSTLNDRDFDASPLNFDSSRFSRILRTDLSPFENLDSSSSQFARRRDLSYHHDPLPIDSRYYFGPFGFHPYHHYPSYDFKDLERKNGGRNPTTGSDNSAENGDKNESLKEQTHSFSSPESDGSKSCDSPTYHQHHKYFHGPLPYDHIPIPFRIAPIGYFYDGYNDTDSNDHPYRKSYPYPYRHYPFYPKYHDYGYPDFYFPGPFAFFGHAARPKGEPKSNGNVGTTETVGNKDVETVPPREEIDASDSNRILLKVAKLRIIDGDKSIADVGGAF